MTTFVITLPGTFLRTPGEEEKAAVRRELRPADPRQTSLGREEDLRILTVNDNGTFTVRLEVEAQDTGTAELEARQTAENALRAAGFTDDEAPLGPAAVTGIDA
ncbi:hypothetical protein [Streptomyces sp. NPDC005805]|uniref:hypothetical protein n=1 Tax=Streptomyces sp. NPDC005805 TaxID=3157068 RepID=UPI0033F9AFE1